MVFQIAIDLPVQGAKVQATIDFDTGLIGFTELRGEELKEYSFGEVSDVYRSALFERLEPLISEERALNTKISKRYKGDNTGTTDRN